MRRLPLLLCALMLVPCFTARAQDTEYKPPRKWTYGMFGGAFGDKLKLSQGGARDEDGNIVISVGDRLLKWNGDELKDRDDFCRKLYATKPGDVVEIEFAHPKKGEDGEEIKTAKIKLGDPKQAFTELYTQLGNRTRDCDWRDNKAVTEGGPLREKLWPMVEKHKLQDEWDNLIAAHERELDLWDSYENLSSTDLLLSEPLSAHQWVTEIGDAFGDGASYAAAIKLLDTKIVDPGVPELPKLGEERTPKAISEWQGKLVEVVLKLIDVIGEQRKEEAFAEVSNKALAATFNWRGQPGFAESTALIDAMRQVALPHGRVLGAMRLALMLLTRQLEGLWPDRKREPNAFPVPEGVDMAKFVTGEAICFRSSYGLVAIGGPDRNVWTGGSESPAVIFDIGGDDEYIDCATTHVGHAVSIVYDKTGNDRYRSTGKWGVACGMLGTALLVDETGDDTYECADWGIGTAFGGIGLLTDLAGNDRYLGGSNSIGCAAYGVGGVIDLEGNDIYDSHSYSVGCGQPGGVGFVLDHSGDDLYRCTRKEPSPYGTEGEWFGGGIGCGFGWRTLACGGIGLVVDVKGNDIYDAGEFGLACGYFMGVGAVRDMDGDDIYHSSRYGLAAGAHAAVGVFMDDKGNDVYEGKTAASIGGAWDIVTSYFYDGGGDDNYRCDGLGLGGAAQNAFAIFWDAGGNDVYRSGSRDFQHGGRTIGKAGAAEYSGGRLAKNFGIFMDTGGGKDNYPRDNRKNDTELVEPEYAIFLDE